MIVYFAGAAGSIRRMPHASERYVHVLFSFWVYQKGDWRWMRKRKKLAMREVREGTRTDPATVCHFCPRLAGDHDDALAGHAFRSSLDLGPLPAKRPKRS